MLINFSFRNSSMYPAVQKNQERNFEKNKNKNTLKTLNLEYYPKNYYLSDFNLPVSFGRKLSHEETIQKIGRENFPSPAILQRFALEPDKPLYEIHKEHYKGLLECSTLEEAEQIYPEFAEVINAEDINKDIFNRSLILKKIQAGEIEGLTIENLALEL